jgi:hypothetical protein
MWSLLKKQGFRLPLELAQTQSDEEARAAALYSCDGNVSANDVFAQRPIPSSRIRAHSAIAMASRSSDR